MFLKNAEGAIVDKSKICDYLLNTSHPDGGPKARFFIGLGFRPEEWLTFASALQKLAIENEITKTEKTAFGNKYLLEGLLETPLGKTVLVKSVWFIANNESLPKLVTVYPV